MSIFATPDVYGSDGFAVRVRLIIRSDSAPGMRGPGIRSIIVLDAASIPLTNSSGELLADFQVPGCPGFLIVDLGPVSRARLPIRVGGTECDSAQTIPEIPLLTTDRGAGGVALPCSALVCVDEPVCIAAQATLQLERNRVIAACTEVRRRRDRRNYYAVAAAIATALALACFGLAAAVAAIPGAQWATIGLGLLGAALLGAAIGFTIRAAMEEAALSSAGATLQQAQNGFGDAQIAVGNACCPGCVTVDLTLPECS